MKKNAKPATQAEINEKLLYATRVPYWVRAKQYGDVSAIAEELKMSTVYVSRAINTGQASLEVLRFIDRYYRKREEVIKTQRNT